MINQEELKDFLPSWVFTDGEASDVAFSSRIRLARNLKNIPFPSFANEQHLATVNDLVKQAFNTNQTGFGALTYIPIEDLTPNERLVLVEKHLCSPQFIEKPHLKSLVVNREQSVSIMVNEEDHLRIQTIMPGFLLENAFNLANQMDDFLEESLEYCFDECCGYLTACPTNVGTGIRASVMLHLPGLTLVDQVKRVLSALSHIGVNVRGMYGEGTESFGDLYQISNQITLGRSEADLTNNLRSVCRQAIEQERTVREALLKDSKAQLEDKLCRSYGILTQARILTSQESLKLLSDVKLGVEVGIIPGISKVTLRKLIFLTKASILQKVIGKEVSPAERDFYRAKLIREALNSRNPED